MKHSGTPKSPVEKDWKFTKELKKPYWQNVDWTRPNQKGDGMSFAEGVSIKANFHDPKNLLDSAYQDLERFLKLGKIRTSDNKQIVTEHISTEVPETFNIEITREVCKILAGDTEGIRRGIYFIEEEMLCQGAPFLPLGKIHKKPVIQTRISRPFFGGESLPCGNVKIKSYLQKYWPDEYLNRVAHHGVNGFFHSFEGHNCFRILCPSKIIPEYGENSEQLLTSLRALVQHCARYGIKYYLFCIEPAAFTNDSLILKNHPELAGHRTGKVTHFCTSSKLGKEYLEEATYNLFSAVPGLGGLISICCGERPSHCCSSGAGVGKRENNCSRCSKRDPHDVLADTLAAMKRGMHLANPKAELIAWPYTQYFGWGKEETVKSAGRIPAGVILQHNFESGGKHRQLGKIRTADDYWLSWPGPSQLFRDCAEKASQNNTRVSAKMMISCSHEVESVPFVPVPGIIYDKFQSMRKLSVSSVFMCWGSGGYPSINYKVANDLSFGILPNSKSNYLMNLARRDWGKNAEKVVKAWKLFEKGYRHYPLNHVFGYYGPMHDGPVWPLHLAPLDKGLTPNWKFGFPGINGDRIGECVTYSHTLDETVILCSKMSKYWHKGVVILQELLPEYKGNPERLRDIHVAMALDYQFASGLNILRFYALRERMLKGDDLDKIELLEKMSAIVKTELKIDKNLMVLVKAEPFLGFNSEANGYKYFPEKIEWRMKLLKKLLENEFPQVKNSILAGQSLFPEYTGKILKGEVYHCRHLNSTPSLNGNPTGKGWDHLEKVECTYKAAYSNGQYTPLLKNDAEIRKTFWQAGHDGTALYLGISCSEPDMVNLRDNHKDRKIPDRWSNDCIEVEIEPRRLWPCQLFIVNAKGARRYEKVRMMTGNYGWEAAAQQTKDGWSVTMRIPFKTIGEDVTSKHPIRINVNRNLPNPPKGQHIHSWMVPHPLPIRLVWNTKNPADLGWLVFD